ncbi:MAG: hypothetical protein ACREBO_10405 [Novosphingobium sp.]
MRTLLSGIAIAALALSSASADPGGQGKGGGKGQAAAQAGDGATKGQGGGMDRAPKAARGAPEAPGRGAAMRDARPEPREARGHDRIERVVPGSKGRGPENRVVPGGMANGNDRIDRRDGAMPRAAWRELDRGIGARGLIGGCPPGLAKKNNGCMPPGLARQQDNWSGYGADWWGLRGLRDMAGYRYLDGNLVRLGPNGAVIGYYPLLGGALSIGNPWPSYYAPAPLDPYYVNYYGLGRDYRYLDGAIYRLDPETQAIRSIAALLTGDDFAVGRPLPLGYSVYNVPYGYRDRYVDGPDAWYRYSDGYVYRVDPETQLVAAAIDLLI